MARPLRLEFPGAIYHVTSRGNARNAIFLDNEDRGLFLGCLGEVIARFGWLCHAYCLMDNHYHLLIETPEGNLSLGMRQLNGVYTQRFNRRHGRVGHVLQGRFKAIVVDRDSYLLELCRYVVLNPIRAGMVEKIERYAWSSYPATMGLAKCPAWLKTDWVLGQFAKTRAVARRRYAEFAAEGGGLPSPWPAVRGQALLGSEAFVEKIRPLLEGKDEIKEIPRAQRLLHRPSLRKLFTKAVQSDKALRDEAIRKAYLDYGYTMATIARHAGVHYSTVSKVIKGER
ncbi:MAG: transposase [Gammaproteobacteria bacterium]|nr:transposase [Gammaproteobacteria bacterium]